MEAGTILFYGMPAHGHINPTLPLVRHLARRGERVVYYALPEFQQAIEHAGAEFAAYPINGRRLDLKDGSRLFRFYRLLLEVTLEWMNDLESRARALRPAYIIHDSAAHWGRRVAERLALPAAGFCPLVAIDGPWSASFRAYARSFSLALWRDFAELPAIIRLRLRMRRKYGFHNTGMLDTMMSWESLNILSYAREMQVGGSRFGSRFFFLGPSAIRRETAVDAQGPPDGRDPLVYVSLGTIFNDNPALYRTVFRELGGAGFRVILSVGDLLPQLASEGVPANMTLMRYVDQQQVFRQAAVFITAGGMNSICEAVSHGVPSLVIPQQGEQKINGRQLEKLGFGILFQRGKPLARQLERAARLRDTWNFELARRVTAVHMQELLDRLDLLREG